MNTTLVFCLIAFSLSIDYSLGLISIQAYWINTGGDKSLSGFVFGLYDGLTVILTPLVAWLINNYGLKYRLVFQISLIVNIIGNIIYSLAYEADTWIMILVGRGIAGMGASSLPLLMVYIAEKTCQQDAIGYIKYTSAITRVIGPILGTIFSIVVKNGQIFNLYTLAGWIPFFLGILTLIVVSYWTEEESFNNSVDTSLCLSLIHI